MRMERSPPPQTPRFRLCRRLPPHRSSSVRCSINNCSSNTCKTAPCGTVRRLPIILSTQHSPWYQRKELDRARTLRELPHDPTPGTSRPRALRRHNNYHTRITRRRSMAANISRHRRHISTFRNRTATPASRPWLRTSNSALRQDPDAYRRRRPHPFHLLLPTSAPRYRPLIPNTAAESIRLRMEGKPIRITCHTMSVPVSPSAPPLPITAAHLCRNMANQVNRLSNDNECMRSECGSYRPTAASPRTVPKGR